MGVPGAAGSRSDGTPEAAVLHTMQAFRHAIAMGDSAAAVAIFTRTAWILDHTGQPAPLQFVRLAGCRGWCRPSPPPSYYHVSVLPAPDTALVVETYYLSPPVSARRRQLPAQGYSAVSVVVRQHDRWLISSQTLRRVPVK